METNGYAVVMQCANRAVQMVWDGLTLDIAREMRDDLNSRDFDLDAYARAEVDTFGPVPLYEDSPIDVEAYGRGELFLIVAVVEAGLARRA